MKFKKVRLEQLSIYGSEQSVNIPDGYQFDKIVSLETGSGDYRQTNVYAVMLEDAELSELKDRMQATFDSELERQKKYLEEQYAIKIGNLNLVQSFSDIISKFKIGDQAYYYKEYVSSLADDKLIESHIEGFYIDKIELRKEDGVIIEKDDSTAWPTTFYIGGSKNNNVTKIYKTKEEAIVSSKDYHDKLQEVKRLAKEKSDAEACARKIREDEEILKKAEEIKAQQS
jgi:hypothetical protein